MRVGFTIIYNGKHHLLHNNWTRLLPKMLDYWVIIEGAAHPGGSTSWCNELENNSSTDGTIELIEDLEYTTPGVATVTNRPQGWKSKDEMVNAAILLINNAFEGSGVKNIFLWQLDIDEQWTPEQMAEAEVELVTKGGDCGCFHANHFVGERLVARGTWGEGNHPDDPIKNAYRRLWIWNGQQFKTHEPPTLEGGNGKEVLLSQRFDHYSYYFEKDVLFKQKYYKGNEHLHEKWVRMNANDTVAHHVQELIGGFWGETDTIIEPLLGLKKHYY